MKFFICLIFICTITNAISGTFSKVDFEALRSDNSRVEVSVSKFNPKTISWAKEYSALKSMLTSNTCGEAGVDFGRTQAMASLKDLHEEDKIVNALNNLHKKKLITKAISGFQNLDTGADNEYCSVTVYKFYSVDGEVLELYFDYNS